MKTFTIIFLSIIIIFLFNSCIEHTETIEIAEDGSATIRASYKGKAEQVKDLALPYEDKWIVTKLIEDDAVTDSSRMELEAELTVAYGDNFPSSYAKPDDKTKDLQLQFPTEIKMWTEGNRTYYKFTRTYQARKYKCYDVPGFLGHHDLWDQDLENRVLEDGIFNVSENDRDEYLEQIIFAYAYLNWRQYWEAISVMAYEKLITIEQKVNIENQAAQYLENKLTKIRVLGILGKEEDSIGVELDRLTETIHNQFFKDFVNSVGNDNTKLHRKFTDTFEKIKLDYKITQKLDTHEFAVSIKMPGTIIESNGFVLPEELDEAEWAFKGDELHDKNIPLYVISVVEK